MKTYTGIGTGTTVGAKEVLVNDQRLRHITKHSPDGFNWGYGGSGPADLAYAILYDLYGKEYAETNYQKFKWDMIANLPQSQGWELSEQQIEEWRKREQP